VTASLPDLAKLGAADRGELEELAMRVREHIVRMAKDGGCFIGASLSCADILVHLYKRVLRVSPERLSDPDRDYLLLSKGHDVPALYATLAELGFFPRERLGRHLDIDDCIYWHPNRGVPGVEFHSGSLGHLLSVGMGIALEARFGRGPSRVFVVLGDGELNEGSIWEGLLVAHAKRLGNLVVVIDRNQFQANVRTEDLVPLEPLASKLEAFGWRVRKADGHDFAALDLAFAGVGTGTSPWAIIADTVRGKGLPSIEARADRWFVNLTADEVRGLLAELRGGSLTDLSSETLLVR
jgi:transketolase